MNESADIINKTRMYCEKRPEVLMGSLFGSYAHGYQCKESDIDIALYLKDINEKLEIEIQNDIERLLKKQVDMIILSRAPATLSWNILRKGIPIVIKDRGLFLDFLLDVSTEAQDFMEFNLDAWKRKYETEQADRERLAKITDSLQPELTDVKLRFQNLDFKTYSSNRDTQRNVERCLENIVNASLDIAKIILVSSKLPIPDTYREYFITLYTSNLIDRDTADILSEGVRLRNILAHQYLDIRWDKINKFLKKDWIIYEKFLNLVKENI